MGGHLLMSHKELKRKTVLELVKNKHITLRMAAQRMRLSYRQTLRIYKRFCAVGDAGLVHRNRGKKSNRSYPERFKQKVISRYQKRYKQHDLGPTLAAEKLANGKSNGSVKPIARDASGEVILESWSKWMAVTTTGSDRATVTPV